MNWSRAARTDKGVSAIGQVILAATAWRSPSAWQQSMYSVTVYNAPALLVCNTCSCNLQVVSLKMCVDLPGLIDRINSALPPAIRVFGFCRVTNGFDARKLCDKCAFLDPANPKTLLDQQSGALQPSCMQGPHNAHGWRHACSQVWPCCMASWRCRVSRKS